MAAHALPLPPVPLHHRVAGLLAAGFDLTFRGALAGAPQRVRRAPADPGVRLRLLSEIAREYAGSAFPEPGEVRCRMRRVRRRGDLCVEEVSWASPHRTWLPAVQKRYDRTPRNARGLARLHHRGARRPVVVLLHGYLSGHWSVEERVWPVRALDAAGLDVAFFLLPFHGDRGIPGSPLPPFPSADPRITNEGFRHAIGDLRVLLRWLRGRGHPSIGLMGMSLGGYTSALLSTVEAVDAMVPVIPLGSLADFVRDAGQLGQGPTAEAQHAALARAHASVDPVRRPPRVAPDGVMVLAGRGDRITPVSHARRLAEHFGGSLRTWHGGHLLQAGRRAALRDAVDFLARRLA